MYRIYLINFDFYLDGFATLEEAKTRATKVGFEVIITKNDDLICSWSPLYGYRSFTSIS